METFQTEPLNLTRTTSDKTVQSGRNPCKDCNSEYCIVKKLKAYNDEQRRQQQQQQLQQQQQQRQRQQQSARSFHRFECKVCRKTYAALSSLRKHQRAHVENKLFRCEFCTELFDDEYPLKTHLIQHTKEKLFECTICVKRFARQSSLSAHNRLHKSPEPAFQCNFCGKHFKWKSNLSAHLILHKTLKFGCELCHKIFVSFDRLQEHRQRHENPEKQCRYCEKAFSNRYKVNYHIRLKHRNIAPWQCQFCSESFSTATKFRSHIYEIHDARKPFACEHCDRTFLTRHNLKIHSSRHRESNETFKCDECGQHFQYKRNLYSHMMRHLRGSKGLNNDKKRPIRNNFDPGQYLCKVCKRGYANEMAAFNCTHNPSYLQNEINNQPNGVQFANDTDQTDNDSMKVKISFVAGSRANQTIPLYELNIPVAESTSREIDSRNTKPALECGNTENKPVILVQAFTTPLNSSSNGSIKPKNTAKPPDRMPHNTFHETLSDSVGPEIIVIGDSSSSDVEA